MDDYTKQLERRIEELQEQLTKNQLSWIKHESQDDRYFIFFNRCLLAQCFDSHTNDRETWHVCIYSSLGSSDKTENGGMFETLEEAKAAALKIIYSPRDFGTDT